MKTNRRKYPKANLGASKRKRAMRKHNAEASKATKRNQFLLGIGAGVVVVGIAAVVIVRRRRVTTSSDYSNLPPPPDQIPRPTPYPMEPIPQAPSVQSTSTPAPTIGPIGATKV